jgi:hypothetical protein
LESKLTNTQKELEAEREEVESKSMEILQLKAQKYQLAEGGSKERGAIEAREQIWAEDKVSKLISNSPFIVSEPQPGVLSR